MKKAVSTKVSQGWVVLGIIGILICFAAWIREGSEITSGAGLSYLVGIVFFVFATISGFAATKNKLWGKVSLTIASALLLLYCLLFLGHVWTSFGVIWLLIVSALCVFAIITIPIVWLQKFAPTSG